MSIAKCISPACFDRQLHSIFKKYKKSEKSVKDEIEALKENPALGDRMPGFSPLWVYKYRIALKEYDISKRRGLRVVYMVIDKTYLVMIAVYYKGDYRSESETVKMIREHLKEANEELS